MRSNFIPRFIKSIVDFGIDSYQPFTWNPHYYKGVHIGGPRYNRQFKNFKNLEYRGIFKNLGRNQYQFTQRGRLWFNKSLLKYHRFLNTKWDNKWRIIIFDIPQGLHNERNKFRQKLNTLGFYKVQKSVFAFPYPCEEELAKFCMALKISDYVNVILADNLGFISIDAKKFFDL